MPAVVIIAARVPMIPMRIMPDYDLATRSDVDDTARGRDIDDARRRSAVDDRRLANRRINHRGGSNHGSTNNPVVIAVGINRTTDDPAGDRTDHRAFGSVMTARVVTDDRARRAANDGARDNARGKEAGVSRTDTSRQSSEGKQ